VRREGSRTADGAEDEVGWGDRAGMSEGGGWTAVGGWLLMRNGVGEAWGAEGENAGRVGTAFVEWVRVVDDVEFEGDLAASAVGGGGSSALEALEGPF
jgi:hypothetical protein